MSKKKNTLKDLDAFLKQQAASLVSPPRITTAVEDVTTLEIEELPEGEEHAPVTVQSILESIKTLSGKEGTRFKSQLYDLILKSVESQLVISPEDRMLINTVLYIKGGDNWKENIQKYWRSKAA